MSDTFRASPLLHRADKGANTTRGVDMKPMLASKTDVPIHQLGSEFVFEPKCDGIRALSIDGRLFTRSGTDITDRFPEIDVPNGVVDGEVVMNDARGYPNLSMLQGRTAKNASCYHPGNAVLVVFDLLVTPGDTDVRCLPLEQRRYLLTRSSFGCGVQLIPQTPDGMWLWAWTQQRGAEGVVAKDITSRYHAGRSPAWLKYKKSDCSTFVVTGFDRGEGSRSSTFGALTIAAKHKGQLLEVGRVGSGFSHQELQELRTRLDHGEVLLIDVSFMELTKAGRLRFPVFLRVRDDLTLTDILEIR